MVHQVFLDNFKLCLLTVQCHYDTAYEVWDKSGAIAREMLRVWPKLVLSEVHPNQQNLRTPGVQIQTGINVSTLILWGANLRERTFVDRINEVYKVWRNALKFDQLTRVSTRGIYACNYETIEEANTALNKLNLAKIPSGRMFDQVPESGLNTVEVAYQYQDASSFSILRFKTETSKFAVNPDPPFEDEGMDKELHRFVVDFDRGLVGTVNANKFQMDEWMKGFQHILRRDIEKLTGPVP